MARKINAIDLIQCCVCDERFAGSAAVRREWTSALPSPTQDPTTRGVLAHSRPPQL